MKTIIGLVLLVIIITNTPAIFAEQVEMTWRFLPSKFVENSEGTIQVYLKQGGLIIPEKIVGIKATSLDSSIVRVMKVEENKHSFISEIYIKTGNSGSTKIYLLTDGFSRIEIPVTVYDSKQKANQLLIKTIPESFSMNGPKQGLIAVELVDKNGFPIIAKEDTIINLEKSKSGVIKLVDSQLIIKKGEYFAYGSFQAEGLGETAISASSEGMDKKSVSIKVSEPDDLSVKLYVIPSKINTYKASEAHIIAQLQDSDGSPVLASKDITLYLKIKDSMKVDNINESGHKYDSVKTEGYFQINKGSYWAHTTVGYLPGVSGTFTITIQSTDPLMTETATLETIDLDLMDTKYIQLHMLPILATGQKELIGVAYLEDESGNPIRTQEDVRVVMSSSDNFSLKVENPVIKAGRSSVLIFGTTGNVVSENVELLPLIEKGAIIPLTIFGAEEESIVLKVEQLVPKILSGTNFPLVAYVVNDSEIVSFPKSIDLEISSSDSLEIDTLNLKQDEAFVILDSKLKNDGTATIKLENYGLEETVELTSVYSDFNNLQLDHFETLFKGINDVFLIQSLDSEGAPVFADADINVDFHIKDPSLVEMPKSVTIKKGQHFTLFDVAPKAKGETEISAFVEGHEPFDFKLKVLDLTPSIQISSPDLVQQESFTATISVKRDEIPLKGLDVVWSVKGGDIQLSDSLTNQNGEAIAAIMPASGAVSIEANVKGEWYTPMKVNKMVQVNVTGIEVIEETTVKKVEIFGIDPIVFGVPAAIAGVGFFMKKKGLLKANKS